jgi:hypothetical protein
MSLIFGYANPELQKVLLELCFSDYTAKQDFRFPRLKALDLALQKDILSGEQLRILPLLYRSTSIASMSSESITKIVGIYKHTFCRNNLMLHRLGQVQAAFNQAGFSPMIGLKGLPAIIYLEEGIGARPMADVDVLIPSIHQRPKEALSILTDLGYKKKYSDFRCIAMSSPENFELDLHWYIHDWALGQELVNVIAQKTRPQIFQSQIFLIPCVEHHLAHTIAHGVLTKTLTYDARWVFDVIGVLRQAKQINFDRFAEFANQVAAPQLVRNALSALLADLPQSIQIDREQLRKLKSAVMTNSKLVSWLYQQTPVPNINTHYLWSTRTDRIKAMLINYVWMPKYVYKCYGLTFFQYWRWLGQFPPVGHSQAIWLFFKKLILRGPVFIYQIIARK